MRKIISPRARARARDREEVVPVLERERRVIRVVPFAAEPTGRETLLRRAFQRQVPTEQRSQHWIALVDFPGEMAR